MRKLGLIFRETSENYIRNELKVSSSVFVVKYSHLRSPDLSSLRQTLKTANANFLVVKNTIARRALKDSGLEEIIKFIEAPCGLVFVKDEAVGICQLLYNFSREHQQLRLDACLLKKDRLLNSQEIETLAKLPSLENLRLQLVIVLNSPILRLTIVLKQILRRFVYCLEQIKNKKSIQS